MPEVSEVLSRKGVSNTTVSSLVRLAAQRFFGNLTGGKGEKGHYDGVARREKHWREKTK